MGERFVAPKSWQFAEPRSGQRTSCGWPLRGTTPVRHVQITEWSPRSLYNEDEMRGEFGATPRAGKNCLQRLPGERSA